MLVLTFTVNIDGDDLPQCYLNFIDVSIAVDVVYLDIEANSLIQEV